MQATTLENVIKVKGSVPYLKTIRAKVVAVDVVKEFTSEKGEKKQVLNAALADSTRSLKIVIYANDKFRPFKQGASIMLRNIIKKEDHLVVTTKTLVMPTQDVEVKSEYERAVVLLIHPPPAPVMLLKDALASPPKTRISVQGKIIQEDETYTVMVKADRVSIKNIYLQDGSSPKAKVSLWREMAQAKTYRVGDYVKLTDVVVNLFKNETSFNSTGKSTMEKIDVPSESKVVFVIGAAVEDMEIILLLNDETTLEVPTDLLLQAFPTAPKEGDELEKFLLENQPDALKQLIALYVGRCFICWKLPEVMEWLERNVKVVIEKVDNKHPLIETYSKRRKDRYKGTPRNIYRHILVSEISTATATIPQDIASTVMSFDPLPPLDSVERYSRPSRPNRAQTEQGGAFTSFLRSLMPNYNPNEPAPQGAEGGGEGLRLREGAGTLMDAMREMLNNIQMVEPPVDGQQGDDDMHLEEWD